MYQYISYVYELFIVPIDITTNNDYDDMQFSDFWLSVRVDIPSKYAQY